MHTCVPDPPLPAGRVARTPRTQFPSSKSPLELGAIPRCPQGAGPQPLEGGSSAGLCAEHDVLLSVCDIHAYKCTLVRAASKKMQIKEHPVPPQGYPKAQLSPAK